MGYLGLGWARDRTVTERVPGLSLARRSRRLSSPRFLSVRSPLNNDARQSRSPLSLGDVGIADLPPGGCFAAGARRLSPCKRYSFRCYCGGQLHHFGFRGFRFE